MEKDYYYEYVPRKNGGKSPCETCSHKQGDPECKDCVHGETKRKGEPKFHCKAGRCPFNDGTGCIGKFENACVSATEHPEERYDTRCRVKFLLQCDICPGEDFKECKHCILGLENIGTNKFSCVNRKCMFQQGGRDPICTAFCENVCGAAVRPKEKPSKEETDETAS